MAEDDDALDLNRYGRRSGFGRGRTISVRNVPLDVLARFDGREMQSLLRDLNGQFKERGLVANALEAAHHDMAVAAGEFMVRAFDTAQREVGRPQNRPGYFRKAIRDPGNRITTPTGWGIGLPEHYDRSPANRYWRFIEFGGANPMEKVVAKGAIGGSFWNPFPAPPSRDMWRQHGRFRWRYLQDTDGREGFDPPKGQRFREAALRAGAVMGTPDDPTKYIVRTYPIPLVKGGKVIGTKSVKLYFRKPPSGTHGVKRFAAFDGYYFHMLGGDRFLAARTPSDVYRRHLAPLGVTVT